MNNPILTTRKTSTGKFVANLFGDGIGVAIAIWCFKQVDKLERYWKFSEAKAIEKLAIVMLMLSAVEFLYHLMLFSTYADVYEDRIAGKGIEKFVVQSTFDLRFDQIVSISQNKGFLNTKSDKNAFLMINTAAGSYKISTTAERANEIMEFYLKNKR